MLSTDIIGESASRRLVHDKGRLSITGSWGDHDATPQNDGRCQLRITAEPNRTWLLQASSDLQRWTEVASLTHSVPVRCERKGLD